MLAAKNPAWEGLIARRILLNFRADIEVARTLVPEPLEVVEQNGCAVVGVCLMRLEQLRPAGSPAALGITSENMAHRIVVRDPAGAARKDGIFVWRRDSDQPLFPGVHHAQFRVNETEHGLALEVRTEKNEANVWFGAVPARDWRGSPLFRTVAAARRFLGPCSGGPCQPLEVHGLHTAFYEDRKRFPRGSVEFDSALIIRCLPFSAAGGVEHEWGEFDELPELAAVP